MVLSSGWGAANASLLISLLRLMNPGDPELTNTTWVLDNNVSRRNGGYGTRLPVFAAVGVNPVPTPSNVDTFILDVGYQYDINSNIPAYILNLPAMANSLLAYLEARLGPNDVVMPQAALDDMNRTDPDPNQHYHFIANSDGTLVDQQPVNGTVTYVTYTKDHLPLLAPLRMLPGGDLLIDSLTPLATVIVNSGYPHNDPLSDPSVYRPGSFVPPPWELLPALFAIPGAILDGVSAFRDGLTGVSKVTPVEKDSRASQPISAPARATEEEPPMAHSSDLPEAHPDGSKP